MARPSPEVHDAKMVDINGSVRIVLLNKNQSILATLTDDQFNRIFWKVAELSYENKN